MKGNGLERGNFHSGEIQDRALYMTSDLEFSYGMFGSSLERVRFLEFQNDCLKATIQVLRESARLSHKDISNAQKAAAVDILRPKYHLKDLLIHFKLSKSSYFVARHTSLRDDDQAELRALVKVIFHRSNDSYGYRRIQTALREEEGITVSEKVIRRIMCEEHLVAKRKRTRRCGIC